jgi:N-acetylglutamate synthase-like GNAT family acetyltransferase
MIRKAQISDVRDLQELYLRHLTQYPPQEPQDEAAWAQLLDILLQNPDYYLLVNEENGKVVSSVTLVIIKNLTHNLRPYAVIENVVTHAEYRNKGYASDLMDYASDIAKLNNCYKIMLLTGSKKESTLAYYERCGFNKNDKTAFIKWL